MISHRLTASIIEDSIQDIFKMMRKRREVNNSCVSILVPYLSKFEIDMSRAPSYLLSIRCEPVYNKAPSLKRNFNELMLHICISIWQLEELCPILVSNLPTGDELSPFMPQISVTNDIDMIREGSSFLADDCVSPLPA